MDNKMKMMLKIKTQGGQHILVLIDNVGTHADCYQTADTVLLFKTGTGWAQGSGCQYLPSVRGRLLWPTFKEREETLADPAKTAALVLGHRFGRVIFSEFANDDEGYRLEEKLETSGLLGYRNPAPCVKTDLEGDLSEEMLERFPHMIAVVGETCGEEKEGDGRKAVFSEMRHVCICSKCGSIFSIGASDNSYEGRCPECGFGSTLVIDPVYHSFLLGSYMYGRVFGRSRGKGCSEKSYLAASAHPDGASISKITMKCAVRNGIVTISQKTTAAITNRTREGFSCLKYQARGTKEEDAFRVLNLKGYNMLQGCGMQYPGYKSFYDFALANQESLHAIGFTQCLKAMERVADGRMDGRRQCLLFSDTRKIFVENLFIVYMGLVNRYPAVEQVVKSGYARLVEKLYEEIFFSNSADKIMRKVEKICEVIDPEATKGKDAMRFPSYIGDYLLKKGAGVQEYIMWCNFYELWPCSREQFEEFTESVECGWFTMSFLNLGAFFDILKYGYEPRRLIRYLMKNESMRMSSPVVYLRDYLNMCECMHVEPDYYPMDLKKQHNDMVAQYELQADQILEDYTASLAKACDSCVNTDKKAGIPSKFPEYTVVFPECQVDFINEGNAQHNCVGSYYLNVAKNKRCIVFFIRESEKPDNSFVTAEYSRNAKGVVQIQYSNARDVRSGRVLDCACQVAELLTKGILDGSIPR